MPKAASPVRLTVKVPFAAAVCVILQTSVRGWVSNHKTGQPPFFPAVSWVKTAPLAFSAAITVSDCRVF